MSFPFSNESLQDPLLEMGEIKNETEQVVAYNGDAEIGVTITIHAIGEVSNITIYNTGTREVMRIDTDKLEKFTGSGIIAGDEIIICTVKGNKSITLLRNGKTTNVFKCWIKMQIGSSLRRATTYLLIQLSTEVQTYSLRLRTVLSTRGYKHYGCDDFKH